MKKKKLLRRIRELNDLYVDKIKSGPFEGYLEKKIEVESHQELIFLISNLIKVCIRALEDGEQIGDKHISNTEFNVSEILRLVLDLMPFEHFEYMEELEKLLHKN